MGCSPRGWGRLFLKSLWGRIFRTPLLTRWSYGPPSLRIKYFEEGKNWKLRLNLLENWRFGVFEPVRGAGFGKSIAVGNIGLEVNDGGAFPGVQVFYFDDVALYADNSAGGEADEVGAFRRGCTWRVCRCSGVSFSWNQ